MCSFKFINWMLELFWHIYPRCNTRFVIISERISKVAQRNAYLANHWDCVKGDQQRVHTRCFFSTSCFCKTRFLPIFAEGILVLTAFPDDHVSWRLRICQWLMDDFLFSWAQLILHGSWGNIFVLVSTANGAWAVNNFLLNDYSELCTAQRDLSVCASWNLIIAHLSSSPFRFLFSAFIGTFAEERNQAFLPNIEGLGTEGA